MEVVEVVSMSVAWADNSMCVFVKVCFWWKVFFRDENNYFCVDLRNTSVQAVFVLGMYDISAITLVSANVSHVFTHQHQSKKQEAEAEALYWNLNLSFLSHD